MQDPSAESAEEAPEHTENIDIPSGAEMVHQGAQTQTEEEEISEKVQPRFQVLDGKIPVGTVTWHRGTDGDAGGSSEEQNSDPAAEDEGRTNGGAADPAFDSDRSVVSFPTNVTEGIMQQMAEVLCQAGHVKPADTQETVRKMALMKTE